MKKYKFEEKPLTDLDLAEKELLCTKIEVEYQEELKQRIAEWSDRKRTKLLRQEDTIVEGDYKFRPMSVPLDGDGYCQSFTYDKKEAIANFFAVYGFVVVRDCLSPAACEDSVEEVWDFIERHTDGVSREDNETWNNWMSMATLGYLGTASVLSPQFAVSCTYSLLPWMLCFVCCLRFRRD